MSETAKLETYVHVTIANLNKPGSFVISNQGNGFTISGWEVLMGSAVFMGKVLGTKEVVNGHVNALGICLDDGTGVHVFNDTIRNVSVKKGDYIKIFGVVKPNKQDRTMASVIVHVIRKYEEEVGSVMSCFMLEAIQAVAMVMGNGKPAAAEPEKTGNNVPPEAGEFQRDGMNATSAKVLGIVVSNVTDSGAQCPDDFKMTGLKENKLREILNKLADDGHIYPTVDDDHYKST